jgi:RNA polymerase sigma-70 factor, ECF subfamily
VSTTDAITVAIRTAWPKVVATLTRQIGDLQRAEDAVQEASVAALRVWSHDGMPESPEAWLLVAARRKCLDMERSTARARARELADAAGSVALGEPEPESTATRGDVLGDVLGDDALGLMFMCCHPALSLDARVALTLRSVGGLTTAEIAAGFASNEATIHQRIVRAKQKIRTNSLRFEIPDLADVAGRLTDVHGVLYLVFNEGYAASHGTEAVRVLLCDEAIRITTVLHELLPDHAETRGLLALMQLHHARRRARVRDGRPMRLAEQDRRLWDREMIARAAAFLRDTLALGRVGSYQLQASIAALHAEAASFDATDWQQIAGLYAVLRRFTPSPSVAINHAIALSFADGPAAGLALLDSSGANGSLDGFPAFHAARADMCERLGDTAAAQHSWNAAQRLAHNPFWQIEIAEHLTIDHDRDDDGDRL